MGVLLIRAGRTDWARTQAGGYGNSCSAQGGHIDRPRLRLHDARKTARRDAINRGPMVFLTDCQQFPPLKMGIIALNFHIFEASRLQYFASTPCT
jgi:hypothetical protein